MSDCNQYIERLLREKVPHWVSRFDERFMSIVDLVRRRCKCSPFPSLSIVWHVSQILLFVPSSNIVKTYIDKVEWINILRSDCRFLRPVTSLRVPIDHSWLPEIVSRKTGEEECISYFDRVEVYSVVLVTTKTWQKEKKKPK